MSKPEEQPRSDEPTAEEEPARNQREGAVLEPEANATRAEPRHSAEGYLPRLLKPWRWLTL